MAPEFISSLFFNINLMYLLISFANWGVVGHIRVTNLLCSEKSLKPLIVLDTLLNMASRVFPNLPHSTMKWCSVSTHLFAVAPKLAVYLSHYRPNFD